MWWKINSHKIIIQDIDDFYFSTNIYLGAYSDRQWGSWKEKYEEKYNEVFNYKPDKWIIFLSWYKITKWLFKENLFTGVIEIDGWSDQHGCIFYSESRWD